MGKFFDTCPPHILDWIQKQHLFWVATAPLQSDGHVNVSPKGAYDCFHVINPSKVWYEDLTGSGNETISHLRENGRITIMFNAFDGPPRIVRLFGTGSVYEFGTPEYENLIPKATRKPGSRSAIVIDVNKVGTSCGYSIPYYEFKGNRTLLMEFLSRKENADASFASEHPSANPESERAKKGLRAYWVETNAHSIDGLPGVASAPYASDVPKSDWTLEKEPHRLIGGFTQPSQSVAPSVVKAEINTHLESNVKAVVAFTLGILVSAIFMGFERNVA